MGRVGPCQMERDARTGRYRRHGRPAGQLGVFGIPRVSDGGKGDQAGDRSKSYLPSEPRLGATSGRNTCSLSRPVNKRRHANNLRITQLPNVYIVRWSKNQPTVVDRADTTHFTLGLSSPRSICSTDPGRKERGSRPDGVILINVKRRASRYENLRQLRIVE